MTTERRIHHALITGGAGFIGSHLVEALLQQGVDRLTVLDNFSQGSLLNLEAVLEKLRLRKANIVSEDWREVLLESDYDFIFHFAGNANVQVSVQRPDYDYLLNLHSTFKLLEAIRELRWPGYLIFSSSAAVYGNPLLLPIGEADPACPISPYGVSKLAAEKYISIYSRLYNLKAASMRSASVYGPRLKKQVVYDIFQKISRNPQELEIYGDGSQTRDFIFAKDVVRAAIDIAIRGELSGEVYNVATGRSHSIFQLAQAITEKLGVSPRFVFTGDVRAGEPANWEFDIQKLQGTGFHPAFSLRDGIAQTVEWYLAHDDSSKP